jgi:glycosyltransferase involved in cell wall biosynthesis
MSGIGTYYETLLDSSLPRHVNLQFVDTSLRRRPGSETGKWEFSNLVSAVGDCIRFTRAVVVFRPEICHIATAFGLSFLKHSVCIVIARLFGTKVLLHPHCSFSYLYEQRSRTWQWFVRRVVGLCQGIAAVSVEWRGMGEVVPGCQIYDLPNAINLSAYVGVGQAKIESKSDKPLLHVLYLGHIGREKGSFDLVGAAKKVLEQDPRVVFQLVGQEQVNGDIEQLHAEIGAAGLDRLIHILPAVTGEEKIGLFRSADIFVYPSHHEGMPMAVIEAMACGLPIIATQVGGLPDLVDPGVNGLLVPAGEPDQLAIAIEQLVNHPQMRDSMEKESLRLAQEDFDIERLVVRLMAIYQALLLPRQKIAIR